MNWLSNNIGWLGPAVVMAAIVIIPVVMSHLELRRSR